ncbi:MAG: hypothetical protein ACFFF9_14785 [Candidatus Thorarchaeota archaeon]
MTNKLVILSAACCDPRMESYDQQYRSRLEETLEKIGLTASIEILPVTAVMFGGYEKLISQIRPHFEDYGFAIAPALFINEELALYGGVPPLDVLITVLNQSLRKNAED